MGEAVNLEAILFNDDACEGNQAEVTAVFHAGQTFYLRLGDQGSACTGRLFEWSIVFNGEVVGCTDPLSCNYDPLATVDDGSCLYGPNPNCPSGPDLIITPGVLASSVYPALVSASDGCYISEGCLQGYGLREVVRFTTHIQNVGTEDYVIGAPNPNSGQFEFDECHGHWHQEGYAEYRMYDENGVALPVGFKNGFCVLDLECNGGGSATYGCSYMGISAGCGDIYHSGLACQWIDVTDLPDGIYTLVIVVNWDRDADLFGREEVSYENNWDQVCFELIRNTGGAHSINVIPNCAPYEDCAGVVHGDAQPDCFGNCNGDAKYGDLNVNSTYEVGDVLMYLNGILDNSLPVYNCTDLTSNDQVDIEDAVWLMDCILVENQDDGHESHAHSCQLPTIGITNPNQSAEFSLLEHNQSSKYFLVGIRNPTADIVATHLQVEGLVVTNVEILANNYNAYAYFRPDGQVMTFSYSFSTVPRSQNPQPFIRIYYSEIIGENVCLSEVYTGVNKSLERINSSISTLNCFNDLLPCSEAEPEDSDNDGICDDMDVCPGGDDALDGDQDGVPDFCDACPASAINDSDNDGVCDDLDVCVGLDDASFCETFTLRLNFDNYSEETRWEIRDGNNDIVAMHVFYPASYENTLIEEIICLKTGTYTFSIFDSYGDGICCSFGVGSYQFVRAGNGAVILEGGDFDQVESVSFMAVSADFPDEDNDGVCDMADLCPGSDDLADADNDGIPDGCDACPTSATGDSDGDGVCDDADICPGSDDLLDGDGDTVPDGCDLCPGGDDLVDIDHDNIPDECDDTINGGEGTGVELTENSIEEIFPNPTTGELRLVLAKSFKGSVQVFDIFGSCVLTYPAKDEKYLRLNVELLPAGTYIVLLNNGGAYGAVKRFVKINR